MATLFSFLSSSWTMNRSELFKFSHDWCRIYFTWLTRKTNILDIIYIWRDLTDRKRNQEINEWINNLHHLYSPTLWIQSIKSFKKREKITLVYFLLLSHPLTDDQYSWKSSINRSDFHPITIYIVIINRQNQWRKFVIDLVDQKTNSFT